MTENSNSMQKQSPAVLLLAIAAAVLVVLYAIFGFFISIYNSPDGYGYDLTRPDFFGAVDIILALASSAVLIVFVIGIGKTSVLAASMLTAAAHILAGFVGVVVFCTRYQTEYIPDTSTFVNAANLFLFAFAGIVLLKSPAKAQQAATSAATALVLYSALLVLTVKTCIEYVNEYDAAYAGAYHDYFIGSLISNSFLYISQILFCLCIVLISQKLRPDSAPKEQLTA